MNKPIFLILILALFTASCGALELIEADSDPVDLASCDTEVASSSADADVEALRTAMVNFRGSLSDDLLGQASNCLDDERFYLWHNTPADGNRDGITYGDLSADQLAQFQTLLQAFLSTDGYQKVDEITFLAEEYLNDIQSMWDSDYYSIDMFGDPENSGSWGFQLDGHHAALNFLVHGDTVSIVPAFLGAEPTTATFNGIEFDIFAAERDLALALYTGFTVEENGVAVSDGDSATMLVGPSNRNGDPDPYIGDYDYSGFETGLKYADMSEATQADLLLLMQEYVYNLNTPFADIWWADIMDNIDDTYFVWLDDVETPTATTQFYYRIYNPSVWIEYNMENPRGQGLEDWNHVHTITRIPSNFNGGDYGIFADAINSGGPTTLLEHYVMVDHHALSEIKFDYELDAGWGEEVEDSSSHSHSHDS